MARQSMLYFVFFLNCIYISEIYAGENMRFANFEVVASLRDYVITESAIWVKTNVRSPISCVTACLEDTSCNSVFYKKLTKDCTGHSVVHTSTMMAIDGQGSRYYVSLNAPAGPLTMQQLGQVFTVPYNVLNGDATGSYKRYLNSKHRLQLCDSYDSAHYVAKTSQDLVQYLDMAAPQYGLPVYDWMMSWQVTEHISREFMDIFVDSLLRHSGTGLVLVWDDNISALNTKTRVHGAFRLKGFLLDESKTQKLRDSANADIVKGNAIVYKRTHRLPSPLDASKELF